ncbi:MAG: GAF domain-containing protein [Anaerolineae bacterium]|nr:GAF domain-containing protein [Anaerolineae bacterium]
MSTQQYMTSEIARLADENRQLKDQIHSFREFIMALLALENAAAKVHSGTELFRLLKRILTDALTIVQVQDGSLALLDDETAELEFVIVCGQLAPSLTGYRMPSNEGIAGWVVGHQEPVMLKNARIDARFSQRVDQEMSFETRSILAVPLIADNRVLGVVEVMNKQGEQPFDDMDLAMVWLFCRFAGMALGTLDRDLPFPDS